MAETNVFSKLFVIFAAVHTTTAFSSSSWYCHRLVPQFITSYVTPCTFPCLVVSRHEHPSIIVQSEPEGTPCHIPAGLPQEGKVGKCQRRVCHQDESYKVLKRKRRFICLIALAKLIRLRRQRKTLEQKMWQLREQLARNGYNDGNEEGASRLAGRPSAGAGRFPIDNAGSNMGARSSPVNAGVGDSETSSSLNSETGSGTSASSGARGLGLGAGSTVGGWNSAI